MNNEIIAQMFKSGTKKSQTLKIEFISKFFALENPLFIIISLPIIENPMNVIQHKNENAK